MTRSLPKSACFALILSLVAPLAVAQGAEVAFGGLKHDSSLPVEMTSDQLRVEQSSGKAVFSGNVVIGQGTMRLSAERVEVIYDQTGKTIARLVALGGVTLTNAGEAVEAKQAEYDLKMGQVILSGDVIMTQNNSALSGDRMVIDLNTGTGRIDGRVKTLLSPGQ